MDRAIINQRDRAAEYRNFVLQKTFMEKRFPGFRCALHNNFLVCEGEITPSEHCATYTVNVSYKNGGIPTVRIRRPQIPRVSWGRVHIYREGSLCLYDHREHPWRWNDNLHEKIIPWTAEWLVFYELFLMCGKWLGPEAPHDGDSKNPQQPNNK
jgi:hypothetical protein